MTIPPTRPLFTVSKNISSFCFIALYADFSGCPPNSEALALVRIGRDRDARAVLQNCITKLPLVGKELLKKKHPKPKSKGTNGYVTHGGADQAYAYWKCFGKYWLDSESAMELLNQVVKG